MQTRQLAVNPEDAFKFGSDAFIYGYPMVLMDLTRQVSTNIKAPQGARAPINRFAHMREFPNASFNDVVSPNIDTLYSSAWLDLSQEPLVLHLPDTGGRYYLMPMLDAWTNVFASPGARTAGTREGNYVLVGPNWQGALPKGLTPIQAPTHMVWIIGRIYCDGTPSDYRAVHAIQDQISLNPTPIEGRVNPNVDLRTPPPAQALGMSAAIFFKTLAELLKQNPPAPDDALILKSLARIGIVPGQDFDILNLDPAVAAGLERGIKSAQEKIRTEGARLSKSVNGWSYDLGLGLYGTKYLQRAYVAMVGLGANLSRDAVYPYTGTDEAGNPLNGSNSYILHFSKEELPPVNAFWSLTLYDSNHFLVDNSLNRYAIRSAEKPALNDDGSLDVFIQHQPPGQNFQSNWLPAPSGDFNLILRLYWPKEQVLEGRWRPVPVQRLEEVKERKFA